MTASAPLPTSAPYTVCVFCSASEDIDARYLHLADEVGTAIARHGWSLVTGGGAISAMGAIARAARREGGRTIGVIPAALADTEVADRDADELVVTDGMRARKAEMDRRSDAFLALPGGIGTLEELLEVWVAKSLDLHPKPIVVLDPWGDLRPLHDLVESLERSGFVSPGAAAEVRWTDHVDQAIEALINEPELPVDFEPVSPEEMLEADIE